MINARSLALMKPTAIIINTARGPVINQKDLTQALKEKKIGGAALDVFEQEVPPKSSHPSKSVQVSSILVITCTADGRTLIGMSCVVCPVCAWCVCDR
jgi:phosphoglycerate dehydrogenase-like enzyme